MVRRINVMSEDWDYLIILDACRYDFFSKLYGYYFDGELEKVISVGSNTVEWLNKSFIQRYGDVVYVSANPYINSKVGVRGFNARNHFYQVIDVWDWGWNKQLGTVHPRKVNEAAQISVRDYSDKRFIIHYLQPHCPYINHQPDGSGYPEQMPSERTVLHGTMGDQHHPFIRERLLNLVTAFIYSSSIERTGLFGERLLWEIREIMRLPPASPMDTVRRAFREEGLRQAYLENLKLVLDYVARLVKDLSGITVITSDHGECLGERGRFGHGSGLSDPFLLEVPWFRLKKLIND